jgi:hypothetical protein
MSNPMNQLDVFTTYTYHFELHAAKTWEELKALENIDRNETTEPDRCNRTLLINTRKDAHQIIDNVKFDYQTPQNDHNGQYTATGTLSMVVIEPNGAQFLEKIDNLLNDLQASNLNNLQYGLKIFFVGRHPDNSIQTIPMPAILPLNFAMSSAAFTFKGGEYHLTFEITPQLLTGKSDAGRQLAYSNKNLSVKALTIKEALTQLEKKLNDNYEYVYANENEIGSARKLKYFINILNKDIDGRLSLITKDSFSPDDRMKLTLDPDQTILTWINNIVRSSEELNSVVGASLVNIRREGQPGVKIISVNPRVLLKEDVAELHYDIDFYTGVDNDDDLYEFDFLFCDPGKNVDVMSFDINLTNIQNWFATGSRHSTDLNINLGSTTPTDATKYYSENTQTTDASKDKLNIEKSKAQMGESFKQCDLGCLPSTSRSENSGLIKMEHTAVPATRLMFSALAEANGAVNHLLNFTIRGNLELLTRGIMYPDAGPTLLGKAAIGLNHPTQIKVNIKSPDVGHKPFFYTGKYMLLSISNIFNDGKFTQVLSVQMQNL